MSYNKKLLQEILDRVKKPGRDRTPNNKEKKPIVSSRGQWDHPGQRTIVPTPDGRITMMGVPYPVYGQDETGYGQMMYPGQEYQFPGQMVDEQPIMQNGGWLPQYQRRGQVGTSRGNAVPSVMSVYARSLIDGQVGIPTGDIASLPGVRKEIPLSKEQLAKNKKAVEERTRAENARILAERNQRLIGSEEAKKKPFSAKQLAEETQATGDKFRLFPDNPNSFIDDYLNPGVFIGNMASDLGRIPFDLQQGNYGRAAMSVANPLVTGALAGVGAKNAKQFANNLFNPVAGLKNTSKNTSSKIRNTDSSNSGSFDLEELREIYHNSKRYLQQDEAKFLHKHGVGLGENYRIASNPSNSMGLNQLPPSPSEIRFMPDGTTREIYNLGPEDYIPGSYLPEYTDLSNYRDLRRDPTYEIFRKPEKIKNRSGLTKEEILEKASIKDKDTISKMSETEFENTVLKPNGEIVPYYQGSLNPQLAGSQNITPLSSQQYVDQFNSKLDLLNDIVAQRNKSGVNYQVKGLDESGRLTFYTPPGQKGKNPLIKRGLEDVNIPEGESTWGVTLNPGQWKGNVEDIANKEYFRSIPGLEMSNTMAGVFSDGIPRKGTGTYDSINDYLKQMNLGRVKPGFNSQTEYSRGLWENAVNKGKAVGYYNNPKTVYGTMKSIFPYAGVGALGAQTAYGNYKNSGQYNTPEQYQNGGQSAPSSYDSWFKYNTREGKQGVRSDNPYLDYDYRRYYDDMKKGLVSYVDPMSDEHYPDTYKLPNHPTFSVESMHYMGDPRRQPNVMSWNGDFTPTYKTKGNFDSAGSNSRFRMDEGGQTNDPPIKPVFQSIDERDAYKKRLKSAAERALSQSDNSYLLKGTSYHDIESGDNCINGVCGLNIEAGMTFNKPSDADRYLSGEKFSQAVAKGKEDYYKASGNFQIGDIMQYRHRSNPKSHNKIIYDIVEDDDGNKIYKVIHNSGDTKMKSQDFTEEELKNIRTEGERGYDYVDFYRPGYSIDKPALEKERATKNMSPEAIAAFAERKSMNDYEVGMDPNYSYSIREDSSHANNVPTGMNKFVGFANNKENVDNLVKKLGVPKSMVHDELLNTFGELGQENKWEDRTFGGRGYVENTVEKIFKPKSMSIGPGQIKFNQVPEDLKKMFGIKKTKDLFDWDKVVPLMTAMNIRNRQYLERKAEKGELGDYLTGEQDLNAGNIKYGLGRFTPYMYRGMMDKPMKKLRDQAEKEISPYRMSAEDKEAAIQDYISERFAENARFLGEGSYAEKVRDNIDKNLQRVMPEPDTRGTVMPNIKIVGKKLESGGEIIRRADGSYSQRGLWDNIRANKGSGKKPTKEMLKQERNIKAKEMKNGGTNNPGFYALPEFVQANILANMGYGGMTYPFMQQGGEPNEQMTFDEIIMLQDRMNKLRQFVGGGGMEEMANGGYFGYDGKRHMSNTPTWSGNAGYQNGGPMLYGQEGLSIPKQEEFLDYESYAQAMDEYYRNYADAAASMEQEQLQMQQAAEQDASNAPMPRMNINSPKSINYQGPSVVDMMTSMGKSSASDYNSRKQLATQLGITNYSGSLDQNKELMRLFRNDPSVLDNYKPKNISTPKIEVENDEPVWTDQSDMPEIVYKAKRKSKSIFNNPNIKFYSGTIPEQAELKPSSTKLKGTSSKLDPYGSSLIRRDGPLPIDNEVQAEFRNKLLSNAKILSSFGLPVGPAVNLALSGIRPAILAGAIRMSPLVNKATQIVPKAVKAKAITNVPKNTLSWADKLKPSLQRRLERVRWDNLSMADKLAAARKGSPTFKKDGGIHINPANKGKFTASAQRAGMGVQEFAQHVMGNREDYSTTQIRRANFAHNAAKWNKEEGGLVAGDEMDVTPEQLEMLRAQGYQFEMI